MKNYKIEIWFQQRPEKIKLGTVRVEAEDEVSALESAIKNTEHWVRTDK